MMKELRSKNDEELLQLFVRLKGQLLQMRFLHASGELDKTHKIQQVRRMLARVFTLLNERKVDARKIHAVADKAILHQASATEESVKVVKSHKEDVKKKRSEKRKRGLQLKQENTKSASEKSASRRSAMIAKRQRKKDELAAEKKTTISRKKPVIKLESTKKNPTIKQVKQTAVLGKKKKKGK